MRKFVKNRAVGGGGKRHGVRDVVRKTDLAAKQLGSEAAKRNSYYEKEQTLSIVIPSDSDGIQPINNSTQLQGKKNSLTETNLFTYSPIHLFPLKRAAFTLAEVLITLGIIGIVAVLTLPSVITNYQKKETVTQLKKAYATLSNASRLSQVENGEMQTWDDDLFHKDIKKYVQIYYLPYFQGEKSLTWIDKDYKITNLSKQVLYSSTEDETYIATVKSSDGQLFIFRRTQEGQVYLWIFADINGVKGPNRVGRDIFVFDGRNHGTGDRNKYFIKFWGQFARSNRATLVGDNITEDTPNSEGYGCNKENKYGRYSGYYCGALIMLDGWQIKDDYPW